MTGRRRTTVVVGGGGFIGGHVCAALRRSGSPTIAAGRRPSTAAVEETFFEAELDDLTRLGELLAVADTVVCLASRSLPATSNADLGSEVHNHVESTVRLAQHAAGAGVERFIFASSGGTVYGSCSAIQVDESSATDPLSAYGVSKLAIESYLRVLGRLSDMKTLSLRISNPYGPGQRTDRRHGFITTAIECAVTAEPLTIWGDGSTRRDFIFVEDVAEAFVAAARYDGPCSVMNVGSGRAISLLEAVATVDEVLATRLDVRFESGRAVDVPVNSLSIERARSELNWHPTVDLVEGIRRTAESRAAVATFRATDRGNVVDSAKR